MEEYREPTWALPASWREVVPDAGLMMKRAPEWALPRAKDDRADAMLSAYGVPENATVEEGWTNSFPDGPLRFSEEAVLGQAVTIVEGKGSYSRGHATGDAGKKGYALLGAVVKLNRPFRTMGAYTLCTKFVFEVIGPEKTVLAAREDFLTLVRGVRP